jgi:hypothetical protein
LNPSTWLLATAENDVENYNFPVFYLTSNLTGELSEAVRTEMQTVQVIGGRKGRSYVPCEKQKGSLEDI